MRFKIKAAVVLAAVLGLIGLGVSTANAVETVQSCKASDVNVTWNGGGSFTLQLKGDAAQCTLPLSSYQMPTTWDGNGFNKTASPQHIFHGRQVIVTSEASQESVDLPSCGGAQADAYLGQIQPVVTWPSGSHGFLAGGTIKQAPCAPADKKIHAGVTFKEGALTCLNGAVSTQLPMAIFKHSNHVNYSVAGTVSFGESVTVTATADKGYKLVGKTVFTHTFAAQPTTPDCSTTVTPVAPSVSKMTCNGTRPVSGSITLAAVKHLTYTVNGKPATGTVTEPAGFYTVHAAADEGYEIKGSDTFNVRVLPVSCVHAVISPPPSASNSGTPNVLAFTGSNVESALLTAGGLVGAGVLLLTLVPGRRENKI